MLHGACAAVYGLVGLLVLARPPVSRTGAWLALACAGTACWAAAIAVSSRIPLGQLSAWLEIGRAAAWYGFILHLYRRSAGAGDQLTPAFRTMGAAGAAGVVRHPAARMAFRFGRAGTAVALAPPSGWASPSATCCCWKISISTRRPRRAGTSTCSASRWAACSSTTWCCTPDAVLFHRLSFALFEARAPGLHPRRPADRARRRAQPALGDRHPCLPRCRLPQLHPDRQRHSSAGGRAHRRSVPPGRLGMGPRRRNLDDLRRHPGRRRRRHLGFGALPHPRPGGG